MRRYSMDEFTYAMRKEIINYYVKNKSTIKNTAERFHIPTGITYKILKSASLIDKTLAKKVEKVLNANKKKGITAIKALSKPKLQSKLKSKAK